MNDLPPPPYSSTVTAARFRALANWSCRIGLAILPVLLALGVYYRSALRTGAFPLIGGDAAFHVYQLTQMGEVNGRWWELSEDRLLGQPYQTMAAKHPGLYEGLDLMLISLLTGRFLDPATNYYVIILVVLSFNGWIAAWLVRRQTGSYLWAALAVVLITLNFATAIRLGGGHLHLFKYGWILLTIWAFFRYLDEPSCRKGIGLGLLGAVLLESSFYLGYLLGIALGLWFLACLLCGKLQRKHWLAAGAAALTFLPVAALLTFPVWMISRGTLLADTSFFERQRFSVWYYGSELWQYLIAPLSPHAREFEGQTIPITGEGWYYMGWTVMAAGLIYLAARLRGWRTSPHVPALGGGRPDILFLDRAFGLTAICLVLSLRGGPSLLLFDWIKCFRCYGRAGLICVSLWSVSTPVILYAATKRLRQPWLRSVIWAAIFGIAFVDGSKARHFLPVALKADPTPPAWVAWLARQPQDLRLAAFPAFQDKIWEWEWHTFYYRSLHRHAVLNGCEFDLLEADLKMLGASYRQMTPAGLQFLVTLGYDAFAFHEGYLKENPWIASWSGLDPLGASGQWRFFRSSSALGRFAALSKAELLAKAVHPETPIPVPARTWITQSLDLPEIIVTLESSRTYLAWADPDGRRLTKPVPALTQHVYGPGIPAYVIESPSQTGRFVLVFLDHDGREFASRPYEVQANLPTSRTALGSFKVNSVQLNSSQTAPLLGEGHGERCLRKPLRLVLENRTPYYLAANSDRPPTGGTARFQPGLLAPAPGSLGLLGQAQGMAEVGLHPQLFAILCSDVPPYGHLKIALPPPYLPSESGGDAERGDSTLKSGRITLQPVFAQVSAQVTELEKANVCLTLEAVP